MNIKNVAIALACGFAFSNVALAENTIIATHGSTKAGAHSIGFDFQNNGDVTAFQFLVTLPKGATAINTSSCLSGLPSSFTGRCVAREKDGKVAVVFYSPNHTPLPKGIQEVGTISYRSSLITKPTLAKMVAGSASGRAAMPVSQKVVSFDEPGIRSGESVK